MDDIKAGTMVSVWDRGVEFYRGRVQEVTPRNAYKVLISWSRSSGIHPGDLAQLYPRDFRIERMKDAAA